MDQGHKKQGRTLIAPESNESGACITKEQVNQRPVINMVPQN